MKNGSARVFELLREKFGVVEVALHSGKHTELDTFPLTRVQVSKIYFA